MRKAAFEKKLNDIERLARGSILSRFFKNPIRYISAIGYWRIIYPIKKKGKFKNAKTFFGKEMKVVLPSATEIYLFGAKTHDSEIRLARFLIKELMEGNVFCDVGAHFGYFTLLAADIVRDQGKVISFEASRATFDVLKENTSLAKNIVIENIAAADDNREFVFHEYPVLKSEYNSLVKPSENELRKNSPKKIKITGQKLDDYFTKKNIYPKIIKIDVEGAELQVLSGMADFLKNNAPVVVMEYLMEGNQNTIHEKAIEFMKKRGYKVYTIDRTGKLSFCNNVKNIMTERGMSSDNIVFKKS